MQRLSNWQSALSDYIVACAHQRFRYGVLDCGLFVANCIDAMTGVDVAAELRGRYHSRRDAFQLTRKLSGHNSLSDLAGSIAGAFGISEVSVAFAGRGDAVQLRRGRAASLGMVALHGTELLTPYKDGILRLPLSHATRAWRI